MNEYKVEVVFSVNAEDIHQANRIVVCEFKRIFRLKECHILTTIQVLKIFRIMELKNEN